MNRAYYLALDQRKASMSEYLALFDATARRRDWPVTCRRFAWC